MNLAEARRLVNGQLCMGNPQQLRAKEFLGKAYYAADEVRKVVENEESADLVKAILWLIRKRWNDKAAMNEYV